MPAQVSKPFESAFGHSFADVRVHADGAAARDTASVGAAAMTVGRDIFFGAGRYRPQAPEGQRLLAHELTHVAQWKRGGSARRSGPVTASNRGHLEAEAGAVSDRVMEGAKVRVNSAMSFATPLLHPVYISNHGDQGFLGNAFEFFDDWGYSPITRGVDSIQEIVADLSTRSAIGRVTIVSHAHPTNVMMRLVGSLPAHLLKEHMEAYTVPRGGVIPDASPAGAAGTTAPPTAVTVPGILPRTPTARDTQTFEDLIDRESDQTHLLPSTQLDTLVAAISADPVATRHLARIGSATDPGVRQYLWWTLDRFFIPQVGFEPERAARLESIAGRAVESYQGTMQVAAAGSGSSGGSDRDFVNITQDIERLTAQWQWPVPPAPAEGEAVDSEATESELAERRAAGQLAAEQRAAALQGFEDRAASSPYAIVNAILWNPNFLPELAGADQRVLAIMNQLPELESHFVSRETVASVVNAMDAALLTAIGGASDPLVKQWIWWVAEAAYARARNYAAAELRRIVAASAIRRVAYRDLIIAAAQAGHGTAPSQAEFDAAAAGLDAVLGGFTFPGDAPTRADRRQNASQLENSTQVTGAVADTTFLRQLEMVRAAVTPNTWFEIQGCRAGQDVTYLKTFQNMFANSRARPKVSAPEWFQLFGHYGLTPRRAEQIPGWWARESVRDAFTYWFPILTGTPLPAAPTDQDLLSFLQTPMLLPLISPGNLGSNSMLVLDTVQEAAFLAWLAKHGYRLTRTAEIRQALFESPNFGPDDVEGSPVDWLAESRGGGEVRFRPDPDYANHIKTVT